MTQTPFHPTTQANSNPNPALDTTTKAPSSTVHWIMYTNVPSKGGGDNVRSRSTPTLLVKEQGLRRINIHLILIGKKTSQLIAHTLSTRFVLEIIWVDEAGRTTRKVVGVEIIEDPKDHLEVFFWLDGQECMGVSIFFGAGGGEEALHVLAESGEIVGSQAKVRKLGEESDELEEARNVGHQVLIHCRLDVGDELAKLRKDDLRVSGCWLGLSKDTGIEKVFRKEIAQGLSGVVEVVDSDQLGGHGGIGATGCAVMASGLDDPSSDSLLW